MPQQVPLNVPKIRFKVLGSPCITTESLTGQVGATRKFPFLVDSAGLVKWLAPHRDNIPLHKNRLQFRAGFLLTIGTHQTPRWCAPHRLLACLTAVCSGRRPFSFSRD